MFVAADVLKRKYNCKIETTANRLPHIYLSTGRTSRLLLIDRINPLIYDP